MDLKNRLSSILPEDRILTRPLERYAYASDASYFRLIPQAVVHPISIDEIRGLFRFSQQNQIPLTFRAAGTSLSGQSVSSGILVVLARHWGSVQVEEGGALVRAQPGVVGNFINNVLKPYGKRIGPDPASIDAAMLGGMLANNSSGMCCGVAENAYHTLHSLTLVLPNGMLLDTAAPDAASRLQDESPGISESLLDLRRRLLADAPLANRVRLRHQSKNTDGYSLNALLDFDNPLDILSHLMIGRKVRWGSSPRLCCTLCPITRANIPDSFILKPSMTPRVPSPPCATPGRAQLRSWSGLRFDRLKISPGRRPSCASCPIPPPPSWRNTRVIQGRISTACEPSPPVP